MEGKYFLHGYLTHIQIIVPEILPVFIFSPLPADLVLTHAEPIKHYMERGF
jgi:hypothetical protein